MEENYEQKEYAIDPDADSRRLYLYCYDGTGLLGIGKFGGTVCCDAFVLLSGKRCPASAGSLLKAERGKGKTGTGREGGTRRCCIGRCTTEGCKRVKWMKPVRKGY